MNYESGELPEAYNVFGHAYTESLFTLEVSIRYYILWGGERNYLS